MAKRIPIQVHLTSKPHSELKRPEGPSKGLQRDEADRGWQEGMFPGIQAGDQGTGNFAAVLETLQE